MSAAQLARVEVPTLVVSGSLDRLVRDVPQRASLLPRAQVEVVPDGGHAINEECPQPVNAAILAFLARTAW
jgi:pimeloyl-ACP methyl ester carboxylesterase